MAAAWLHCKTDVNYDSNCDYYNYNSNRVLTTHYNIGEKVHNFTLGGYMRGGCKTARSKSSPPAGFLTDEAVGQSIGVLLPENAIFVLEWHAKADLARGSPKRGNGVSIVDSSGRGGLAFFVPPRL